MGASALGASVSDILIEDISFEVEGMNPKAVARQESTIRARIILLVLVKVVVGY
jgi:hypothetical protein